MKPSFFLIDKNFHRTEGKLLPKDSFVSEGDSILLLSTNTDKGSKPKPVKLFDFNAEVGDSWHRIDSTRYKYEIIKYLGKYSYVNPHDTIYLFELNFLPKTYDGIHLKYYLVSKVNGIRALVYSKNNTFDSMCADFGSKKKFTNALKCMLNIIKP